MASPTKRRATYDDLLAAPENKVAEIVDGELYVSPRPAPRLALAKSHLGFDLAAFHRREAAGWWLLFEPEFHCGEDVLVPDIAGWRRERMPEVPDAPFFTLAPDWVCEVVSPGTERLDRAKKLPVYAREGVAYCWLVNPAAQALEANRLSEGRWLLLTIREGSQSARIEPFDAVELDLAGLWGG